MPYKVNPTTGELDYYESGGGGGSGTVTSVAQTVPTGLTITGSPITTSGTLAIGLDTGYVIPTQASLDAKADLTGDTFTGDISVPDEAYGVGWNGSLEVPTKNAIYDKIETLGTASAINDLTDVTITTPADNEVLAYDTTSGDWINQTPAEAGLAEASHTHTASQVTDFDTEVSNNTSVAANTTHRTSDGSDHTFIDQSVVSGASPTFDGANITGVDAANVDIADAGALITATTVEGALAENRALIDANTAKVSNATHTGEVTGATTLTVDSTAITNKTTVTADGADYVLISDTSDSGNLKKALASDFGGGGSGDVTAAAVMTDNAIVRGDGGAKGVQDSGILISDTDNITGVNDLTVGNDLTVTNDFTSQSIVDNGTVTILPTATVSNAPYSIVNDEPTTNLIVNPRFEVNVADGWNGLTTGTKTRNTSEKWYGSASMQVDTSANNSGVQTSAISVDPSSVYVFSFHVKGASGGEAIDINLVPDVGAATDTSSGFSFPDTTMVTTEWQRFDWYIVTGASTTTVTCQIRAKTASAQTIYVDGVQFEKKTLPTNSTDNYHPSSYCDGSMGDGYSWSGTADNSTSSRTAGVHFLAPVGADNAGRFVQRSDGSFDRMYWRADEITSSQIGDTDEPAFPFQFTGDMLTDVTANGTPGGILFVENVADGNTAYFKSGVSTREGFILDFSSLTSGVGMAVYAPSDLTAMQSSGGVFFKFAGKAQNSDMYKWGVDYAQAGDLGFAFDKRYTIFGGGGMNGTATSSFTGTVSTTAASATVTGTGTTFLTDYKRGDQFEWQHNGTAWVTGTVASVASNTSLTLTANAGQTTAAPRAHRSDSRQYSPAVIQLEGNYGNHQAGDGDYLYSLYPSGGNGQPRWMKGSAIESTTIPTADNDGSAIVVGRDCDSSGTNFTTGTETEVYNGYTTPAYELQAGNWLSGKMIGTVTALNATTTTLTIRIKLGGTTILTSNAFVVGSTNATAFKLNFDIVGTSTTGQKVSLDIVGKDNTTTSAPTFATVEYGTSSVDCRIDRALTVTFDFNDASTANVRATSIKLEQ